MKHAIASITACAVLALASQAAAEARGLRQTTVTISSIDFSSPEAAKALHGRLKSAAHKVCRSKSRLLADRIEEGACRDAAIAKAMQAAETSRAALRRESGGVLAQADR